MPSISTIPHGCIILDTCCIINLHESGHLAAILAATGKRIAVASYVRDVEVKRLDLNPHISSGLLSVVELQDEAEELLVINLATDLEDGEAYTGAIASIRNWAVASDETKVIKHLAQVAPHIQVITTPELIHHWVQCSAPLPDVIRAALESIQRKGRYRPGPSHPLHTWWQGQLA